MTIYRARLTWNKEEILPWLEGLEATRIFAVEHEKDEEVSRTHVHVYLEGVEMGTEGLKKRLMKDLAITTRPKRDRWSFPEGIDDLKSFITYALKGKLEPFYVRGDFDEDLGECRAEWRDPETKREKIQYKIRVENPVQAKARQAELMTQVMKRYKENDCKDLLEIIRQVVYVEHRTIVGRYKIRDYVDYVRGHMKPEGWVKSMELFCLFKE